MSTYLLAFLISNFEAVEKVENGRTFRAFTRPGQANNTAFAIETAMEALKLYESTFDVTYTSNKLDQVAIPKMEYAAMENNFIIFYHEENMLFENGVTRASSKEAVTYFVTHEVSSLTF
jgi:aminopeptidase N